MTFFFSPTFGTISEVFKRITLTKTLCFIHEPLVSSTQNERKNETDENDDEWLRFLLADAFGVFWRETTPKFTRCKIIEL